MATLTWTAPANGFWSTGGNWTPAQVPGAADTVVFDGTGADLSFVGETTIAELSVTDPGALITASGTLLVGAGAVMTGGTLALAGTGVVTLNDLFNRGTITLASGGVLTLTGTYDTGSVQRMSGTGGALVLAGTLDNAGGTLVLPAGLDIRIDTLGLVQGGTIAAPYLPPGEYVGVTILQTPVNTPTGVSIQGGPYTVRDGLAVLATDGINPGTIDLTTKMSFVGDQTFDNGTIQAINIFSGHMDIPDGTLTFGSNAVVQFAGNTFSQIDSSLDLTGAGVASKIVNHGTVQSNPGSTGNGVAVVNIDVMTFQNHGLVAAFGSSAGRLNINAPTFVNEAGGRIEARGTIPVFTPALHVDAGSDFTNDGSVLVSLASMVVDATVQGDGTITVEDSAYLDLNSGVLAGQVIALNGSGTVDLAIPQLFQGTITGLTTGTTLHLDTTATAVSYDNDVLTMRLGGGQTFDLRIVGELTLEDFIVNTGTTGTTITTDLPAPCFAAGTLIRTDKGDVAVEFLRAGDRIHVTSDAVAREVVWIGQRDVDCARHPDPASVWPVRVAAGAFGPGLPARDLYLSPDHAIFFQDVLIPVKHLLNGTTIARVPTDHVSYHHVELAAHAVILAENLPVESYLDTGDRDNFANAGPVMRLFPMFGADPNLIRDARACAPLVVTGPAVAAARALTASRSAA